MPQWPSLAGRETHNLTGLTSLNYGVKCLRKTRDEKSRSRGLKSLLRHHLLSIHHSLLIREAIQELSIQLLGLKQDR